jgi:hypothetical protein
MRTTLSFLVLALAATPLAAQGPTTAQVLQQRERAVWKSVQTNDTVAFQRFLAPDYSALYNSGPASALEEIHSVAHTKLTSLSFSDFLAKPLAPGRMLLTYRVNLEGSVDGHDISDTYWSASIWRRQGDGRWMLVFHTEAPAK